MNDCENNHLCNSCCQLSLTCTFLNGQFLKVKVNGFYFRLHIAVRLNTDQTDCCLHLMTAIKSWSDWSHQLCFDLTHITCDSLPLSLHFVTFFHCPCLDYSFSVFHSVYLVSFHCSCHAATHCIWAARFCVQLRGMKANITSCIESDSSGHVGHIDLRRGAVSLSAAEKQFQQLFKVAPSRWLFQNILLIHYLVDIWRLSRESLFVSHLASLKLIAGRRKRFSQNKA